MALTCGVSRILALRVDRCERRIGPPVVKARVLAAALDGRVIGAGDAEISRAVHPLEASGNGDVAIAVSPDTIRILGESRAKIALILEGTQFPHQRFQTVILIRGSRSSLPDITHVFRHCPDVQPGVHPSAVVAPDAVIGEGATIGPLVVIGPRASVGPRSIILSQATLAAGATLGADCLVYPGVRIGWGCHVGDRAVIHHNASIGADGFSFVPTRPSALEAARGVPGVAEANPERNELQKIHTLSIVEIGDDVEVGALTAIDRGTLKPTRIGSGTKIDDLVMIGHNVEIGMDCLLCGQVGLAGGVVVGDGAVLGGRVGVADHLKIGAWAVLAAAACVGTNVPAGAVYAGYPAVPRAEAMENLKLMRRLRRLEARLTGVGSGGSDSQQSNRDNHSKRS
jgi:UDP-3-O-[3-hydroxymyristoyl] glucosamine N-acyltransferase